MSITRVSRYRQLKSKRGTISLANLQGLYLRPGRLPLVLTAAANPHAFLTNIVSGGYS
jgi:hypothetical protein